MSDLELLALTASRVHPETGVPVATASDGQDKENQRSSGEIPIIQSLGISALPAEPDNDNYCEGVAVRGLSGKAAIIAARDARTNGTIFELKPGETCVHATGKDFDARIFFKDNLVALVVGDDLATVWDRKNGKVTTAAFGHLTEMSEKQGLSFVEGGGASILMKDGFININAKGLNLNVGGTATIPVACGGVGVSSLINPFIKVPMPGS